MKKKSVILEQVSANTVDCLGMFNSADEFCSKSCSLRLRCAIEQNQIQRMETYDDFIYTNGCYKIHSGQ